jgi:Eukaryotic protein of unknown function (DUF829)
MTSPIQLSRSVSIFRPVPRPAIADSTAPKLIILATWMDARDVHIAKYIARYQEMFPTASILLLKSSFRHYFSPSAACREVAPAVEVIRDSHYNSSSSAPDKNKTPQILVHVFSNGGSCMLYHLCDVYAEIATKSPGPIPREEKNDSHLLPLHVTIWDSVPGRWSHSGSTQGFLASISSWWIRMLAFPIVHLLGLWWVIKYLLLKVPEETHVWGLAHNDPTRVREICRSYVYSEADELVYHLDIEEHADHAETNGYVVVRREKFVDSPHVAHARTYPDRYWALVRETWEAGYQTAISSD